jgi:hypothetical protein
MGPGQDGILVLWYFCAHIDGASTSVQIDGIDAKSSGIKNLVNQRGELWYALAAPGSAHTVSVGYTNCPAAYVATISALHVNQTTPIRSAVLDGTDVTTLMFTDPIASAPGDLVLDGVCHGDTIDPAAPPQTQLYRENLTGNEACGSFAGSSQPGATPSVSTTWTSPYNDHWVLMALSLEPAF